jgi:hypothetical protein
MHATYNTKTILQYLSLEGWLCSRVSLDVWEKRTSLPLPQIELGFFHRRASISVTIPTGLSQLVLDKSNRNKRIMLHSSLQLCQHQTEQISISMKIEAAYSPERLYKLIILHGLTHKKTLFEHHWPLQPEKLHKYFRPMVIFTRFLYELNYEKNSKCDKRVSKI